MQSPPFLATIFIVLLLLLTACAKKIKDTPTVPKLSPEEKVTQLGEQLFKKDFSLDYNQDKTVVCLSKAIKRRPNDAFSTLSFVLYRIETEELLFEEIIPKATGKWISNDEFQITTIPGIVPDIRQASHQSGFIYNVNNKTKRKL